MAIDPNKTRIWTKTTPNDGTLFDAEFDRLYANDLELERQVIEESPAHVAAISSDLTGFPNRSDSRLVFDDVNGKVIIQPIASSFDTYDLGEKRTITTPIEQSVSAGGYYLMLARGSETVEVSAQPDPTKRLFAYSYYNSNSTVKFVIQGDERHSSSRDTDWHRSHHLEVGMTMPFSSSVTYSVNNVANIQIGVDSGITARDEDLQHTVIHAVTPVNPFEQTLTLPAKIPVVYLDSNGLLAEDLPGTEPWKNGNSQLAYNSVSENSGSQADVPDGKYVNYWLVFTNCQKYPIKMVQGRILHDDIASAQAEVFESIGLPLPEIFLIRQFVLYADSLITANTYGCKIAAVYQPNRALGTSQSFSAASHNATSGRDGSNGACHPASAIERLSTPNLSQDTTEKALVELSNRIPVTPVTDSPAWTETIVAASAHATKALVDSVSMNNVVQHIVNTVTKTASINSTVLTEVDSDYRISITPKYSTSKILIRFDFNINPTHGTNTLFHMQIVKNPSGTPVPVGVGPVNGGRDRVSWVGRPLNGTDTNDNQHVSMVGVDSGYAANSPVVYGFRYRSEISGANSVNFNFHQITDERGFTGIMTIEAIEIA